MLKIGINPTKVVTALSGGLPETRLGTIGSYDDPTLGYQEFIYGQANGAITAAGYLCTCQANGDVLMASVTSSTPGNQGFGSLCAAAMGAMADNDYGWFQIFGRGSVRTLASAARGTRLNTTGTTGAVDDDGTAGSEVVNGLTLYVATGGAPATNANAYFAYPTIGDTL